MFTGCVVTQPRKAVFIESEYEPYLKTGTGSIEGQAFAKTLGGDVKFAAGNTIACTPVTSYSEEWFATAVLRERRMVPGDPREEKYIRHTTADGFGNFLFENLPAGTYFITTNIVWYVPSKYGFQRTGGWAQTTVDLPESKRVRAIVTTSKPSRHVRRSTQRQTSSDHSFQVSE
jgi:hypothetical protein